MESIYKLSRRIKQRDHSLYNALRSIYHDSLFVSEIAHIWSSLPLLANLRCGLWYSPRFHAVCYFKSTDGHNGNWSFSVTRLNLHVAHLAAKNGGCVIVDATRKGKRFPDSMSKTIPIWACVLNRALADLRKSLKQRGDCVELHEASSDNTWERGALLDWDCQLHLPIWVSETEKNNVANLVDKWVDDLKTCGANLVPLARMLRKPLRTLWVSQKTLIWLNEVADVASLDFIPIFLVSASQPVSCTQRMSDAEFSWSYIPGAADDEESWARGLTPTLFWNNVYDLVNDGPELCNRKVADLVERDRVNKAFRGQDAPQVNIKSARKLVVRNEGKSNSNTCSRVGSQSSHRLISKDVDDSGMKEPFYSDHRCHLTFEDSFTQTLKEDVFSQNSRENCIYSLEGQPSDNASGLHWIGSTGLAVGDSTCCQADSVCEVVDSVINCCYSPCPRNSTSRDSCLHLPVVGSKFDRHSLQSQLPEAVKFASEKLANGLSLLICCSDGEDISVCVCLAILLSCFDSKGTFCSSGLDRRAFCKSDVRQTLVFLASFHSGARPSRGCLKQVYNYLHNLQ